MQYSSINKTKWGVCSTCGGEEQDVVKVKKDLFCLACRNNQKALEQMERVKRRNSARCAAQKVNKLILDNPDVKAPKEYAEMDRWFKERRKEMTGACQHCGGKTQMDIDVMVKFVKGIGKIVSPNYKYSVAHLLPKSVFKSVATHPDNWIELCHFGKSCHKNFDDHYLDLMELNCFDTVIEKFVRMYPSIAPEEKRRIPQVLLQYIEVEK